MSIFGRRELWRELAHVILNEKSLWIHQNNATGLLFGRTERRYHYLTRLGAILGFLVPVAVVRGVERLMNYGIRIDTTLFPLNFLDQMG